MSLPEPFLLCGQVRELPPTPNLPSRPSVVTVVDSEGQMVADRVRVRPHGELLVEASILQVSWGRLENFKCVDYFQIEYYEKDDMVILNSSFSRSFF